MAVLSPQCTSARCHPHSPRLFLCFALFAISFPFHIVRLQVLMPATFRQSPEVLSPDSALTKENVRLLLSLSFSGLLNKRSLVWLLFGLDLWYRRGRICFCAVIIWGTTCRCNKSMRWSLAELYHRREVPKIRRARMPSPHRTVTSCFWSPDKSNKHIDPYSEGCIVQVLLRLT